jgi:hypoxanthine phosphoribosyltransferase
MIAIGGGGYVPARILRSFLKQPGSPNIPIQAIGLSLYETLPSTHPSAVNTPGDIEQPGTKVTRTQWLDLTSLGEMENLVGKRILIVDEVDDTRTTLEYAVKELEKDVELARQKLGYEGEKTIFSIFVLHASPLVANLGRASVLTRSVEQEQGEEGSSARGHAQGGSISGCSHD